MISHSGDETGNGDELFPILGAAALYLKVHKMPQRKEGLLIARNNRGHSARTIRKSGCWNRTFREKGTLRTLVILLPTFYNPDALGVRKKKIEPEKWLLTMAEIERLFSGYQQLHVNGWNSADNVTEEVAPLRN